MKTRFLLVVLATSLLYACDRAEEPAALPAEHAITAKEADAVLRERRLAGEVVPTKQASLAKKAEEIDPTLTYFVVRQEIEKHIGKRVAWVGKQCTYSSSRDVKTGEKTTSYVYLAEDPEGNFFADNPFYFSHAGTYEDTKKTPAAEKAFRTTGDAGVRLIIGTVAGQEEV